LRFPEILLEVVLIKKVEGKQKSCNMNQEKGLKDAVAEHNPQLMIMAMRRIYPKLL